MRTKMQVRGLAPNTVTVYLRSIRRFIAHVGKPLGAVKPREVEGVLLELGRRGVHPRTRNVLLGALRFSFRGRRGRNPTVGVPMAKAPRRTPEILSGSEVKRLLEATTSLKYRAIFLLAYGAGLRVSEGGARDGGHRQRADADPRARRQDGAEVRDDEPARAGGAACVLARVQARGLPAVPGPRERGGRSGASAVPSLRRPFGCDPSVGCELRRRQADAITFDLRGLDDREDRPAMLVFDDRIASALECTDLWKFREGRFCSYEPFHDPAIADVFRK